MASLDPRTPVLVGVGQVTKRGGEDPAAAPEPAALMAEALRRAAADTGVAPDRILTRADSVRVPLLTSWRYRDPGRRAVTLAGGRVRESLYTPMGGNFAQTLVNRSALDIAEGRHDLILLTGGEARHARSRADRAGVAPPWPREGDDVPAAEPFGEDHDLLHPAEVALGLIFPVLVYPLFENALRAADGLSLAEHRDRLGRLWARFSEIAADNPYAWLRERHTADELMTPTARNRMVGFPYPKLLNSNLFVNQAAALVLCSAATARDLGVPPDRWVFVHAGADAHDHWFVSHRADLHTSPAIRIAGRAALGLAGAGPGDVAHVDLYSCFPSAVQIAARELGLDDGRDLTVTGGMSFAGGPLNNFPMHAIATMAGRLRDEPGAQGLVSGNGGFLTKHAFGVYGAEPPAAGRYRWAEPQAEVDALPRRELDEAPDGPATIESYTVAHGRDGRPERAFLALRRPDGRRAWAATTEPATMDALLREEGVGRPVTVAAGGVRF
jgi:acetyl-CoA C-acetyltransferase